MGNRTFRDLIVWQRSMELVLSVYECTRLFPREEQFGLVSQMRRSAVSIPSNISEGRLRGSDVEFLRYLRIAFASLGELETQIEIAKRLSFLSEEEYRIICDTIDEIGRMLNALITKHQGSPDPSSRQP